MHGHAYIDVIKKVVKAMMITGMFFLPQTLQEAFCM